MERKRNIRGLKEKKKEMTRRKTLERLKQKEEKAIGDRGRPRVFL